MLQKIPYDQTAYVVIRDSLEPDMLIKECVDFCRAVGAETVYASGHKALEKFPHHTTIISMECERALLSDTDAVLQPVTDASLDSWRRAYNERMHSVPTAAYMSASEARKLQEQEKLYYVYHKNIPVGLGVVDADRVEALASVIPGFGEKVLLALSSALTGDIAHICVATTNVPACRLYERLGFRTVGVESKWYKIF